MTTTRELLSNLKQLIDEHSDDINGGGDIAALKEEIRQLTLRAGVDAQFIASLKEQITGAAQSMDVLGKIHEKLDVARAAEISAFKARAESSGESSFEWRTKAVALQRRLDENNTLLDARDRRISGMVEELRERAATIAERNRRLDQAFGVAEKSDNA